jgi:hypothetical protein
MGPGMQGGMKDPAMPQRASYCSAAHLSYRRRAAARAVVGLAGEEAL